MTERVDYMLGRLEVMFENPENRKSNYNISSLFQGVMMESIDRNYAEILHHNGLKPYSQHVEFGPKVIKWVINTLDKEAKEGIINPLLNDLESVTLKHKDLTLKVIEKNVSIKSYDQLLNEKYFSDGSPNIELQFITPAAFKSQGEYVFYPDLRLIYQSLMNKFDNSSIDSTIYNI